MSIADPRESVVRTLVRWFSTTPLRYEVAALAVAVAALVGLAFAAFFSSHLSFILFYPAIVRVALVERLGPGGLGTLLSTASAQYFPLGPTHSSPFTLAGAMNGVAWFSTTGVAIAALTQSVRRQAGLQQQTEHSLKLFRTLIDQSNDAVEVVDPETLRFLDINERACKDLGYSREELLSRTVVDINADVDEWIRARVLEKLKDSGFLVVQAVHRRKDGSTFPVETSLRYIRRLYRHPCPRHYRAQAS
jgi:PAS domain S-box-containing protein